VLDERDALWHTIWHADTGWSDRWGPVQGAIGDQGHSDIGPIPFVAVATDDVHDLHVFALDESERLWHTIRYLDGNWRDPWGDVQKQFVPEPKPSGALPALPTGLGPTPFVATAADPRPVPERTDPAYADSLHLLVLDEVDRLWHTIRVVKLGEPRQPHWTRWPYPWGDVVSVIPGPALA
jgi:hypothetical protein